MIDDGYGAIECARCRETYHPDDSIEICGVCEYPGDERDICDDCVDDHKGRMECYRDESRLFVEEEDNWPRVTRLLDAAYRFAVDNVDSSLAAAFRKELS